MDDLAEYWGEEAPPSSRSGKQNSGILTNVDMMSYLWRLVGNEELVLV